MNEFDKAIQKFDQDIDEATIERGSKVKPSKARYIGRRALALGVAAGLVGAAPHAVEVGGDVLKVMGTSETEMDQKWNNVPDSPLIQPVPTEAERAASLEKADQYLQTEKEADIVMDTQRAKVLPEDPGTHVQ